MGETIRLIEKKILPAVMVAVIQCQGGRAFAEERIPAHVQIEDFDQPEPFSAEFEEGYRLFEREIDETADEELKEAGLEGDPATIRAELKSAIHLMWRRYGEQKYGEWRYEDSESAGRRWAVARYDILAHGGKLFFEIKHQEQMIGFETDDYQRFIREFLKRSSVLMHIPMEQTFEKNHANCIITLAFPHSEEERYASGALPVRSFDTTQARIYLPVLPISKYNQYSPYTFDVDRFIRFNYLGNSAVHEFLHIIGLDHSQNPQDIVSGLPDKIKYDFLTNPEKVPERDRLYLPKLNKYVVLSHSRNVDTSPSIKLVRWLRWKAVKGTLKGLLEKAEELAVKRPVNRKRGQ